MANNTNEHMGGALLLLSLALSEEIIFSVLLGGTTSMVLILNGYTHGTNLSEIAHDNNLSGITHSAYLAFMALTLAPQDFNSWSLGFNSWPSGLSF